MQQPPNSPPFFLVLLFIVGMLLFIVSRQHQKEAEREKAKPEKPQVIIIHEPVHNPFSRHEAQTKEGAK